MNALISLNTSSLWNEMGDENASSSAAERAYGLRSCVSTPQNRAAIDAQLARIVSLRGDRRRASQLLQEALAETSRDANPVTLASMLDRLGDELQVQNRLDETENVLSRAFRLRRLAHDPNLALTGFRLARLKFSQGQYASARNLLEGSAPSLKNGAGRIDPYHVFYLEGKIKEAQGDLPGAVASFRSAVEQAARWRGQVLPADSARITTDVSLGGVFDAFISAAARLGLRTADHSLITEAWQAAEYHRAASLRESVIASPEWRKRLPPEYWETLARLRSLEARNLTGSNLVLEPSPYYIQTELNRLETVAGLSSTQNENNLEKNYQPTPLTSLYRVLGNSRMLITYHLGTQASYRWVASTRGLEVTALPPANEIELLSTRFKEAVQNNTVATNEIGHKLFNMLLAGVDAGATEWMLALEGKLFEIPLAALVTGFVPRTTYLIESHTLEVVPGAWAVGTAGPSYASTFLGIGDAVYNRADSRFGQQERASAFPFTLNWSRTAELPRLLGSGQEIERCAQSWCGPHHLLTGQEASRAKLAEALQDQPSVIHIAAHFVTPRDASSRTMVALSLQPSTGTREPQLDLLTHTEISSFNVPGSLVVLSGCSSSAGPVLAGAGRLGLIRAWITAGATNVIATHWATPDDSGELFSHFYRHLRSSQNDLQLLAPAQALRAAQLDMLHAGDWRSLPGYWAAYQLTGRSNTNNDRK